MPEGLSSIDDLKVVITAESESLGRGIDNAGAIIARFTGDAEGNLKSFDGALAKVGSGLQSLRGALGVWAAAATTALEVLDKIAEKGDVAFKKLGAEDEWTQLKESVAGLVPALLGLASGQDGATKSASYLKRELADVSSSLDQTDTSAVNLAKQGLATLTEQLERAAHEARRLNDPKNWSNPTIAAEVRRSEEYIEALKKRIDDLNAGGGLTWFERLFGVDAEKAVDKLEAKVAEFEANRRKQQFRVLEVEADFGFLDGLKREVQMLELKAKTLDMTSAAAATYMARQRLLMGQSSDLSETQMSEMDRNLAKMTLLNQRINAHAEAEREAQRTRQETDGEAHRIESEAARNDKQGDQLVMTIEREVAALNQKRAALGGATAATIAAAAEERAMLAAQQRGTTLSEEQRLQIRATARTLGEQTMAMKDLEKAMEQVKATGDVVARSLEGAFKKWMDGTKIDSKEMVRQILADLAMIAMRKNVLEPLMGAASSGIGSVIGGFMGGMSTGGSLNPGQSALVGEHGPELITARDYSRVIPNDMLAGGGNRGAAPVTITLHTHINAQGAYPESIAEIKRAVAEQQQGLPARVLAVVGDAKERGGI